MQLSAQPPLRPLPPTLPKCWKSSDDQTLLTSGPTLTRRCGKRHSLSEASLGTTVTCGRPRVARLTCAHARHCWPARLWQARCCLARSPNISQRPGHICGNHKQKRVVAGVPLKACLHIFALSRHHSLAQQHLWKQQPDTILLDVMHKFADSKCVSVASQVRTSFSLSLFLVLKNLP